MTLEQAGIVADCHRSTVDSYLSGTTPAEVKAYFRGPDEGTIVHPGFVHECVGLGDGRRLQGRLEHIGWTVTSCYGNAGIRPVRLRGWPV